MGDIVRIHLDRKRKLKFRHRDLRDAVEKTGKSIGELFQDPFGGWAYLLLFGLRYEDLNISLDKASDFIDRWIDEPDPETKTPRTLDDLGLKLLDALNASGFVKIKADGAGKDGDGDEGAEGNATPEAATRT